MPVHQMLDTPANELFIAAWPCSNVFIASVCRRLAATNHHDKWPVAMGDGGEYGENISLFKENASDY